MSPDYDIILNQNGDILIKLVNATDASDAWKQGSRRFAESMRGVVCRKTKKTKPHNADGASN